MQANQRWLACCYSGDSTGLLPCRVHVLHSPSVPTNPDVITGTEELSAHGCLQCIELFGAASPRAPLRPWLPMAPPL
jgi:hypothetical protein